MTNQLKIECEPIRPNLYNEALKRYEIDVKLKKGNYIFIKPS